MAWVEGGSLALRAIELARREGGVSAQRTGPGKAHTYLLDSLVELDDGLVEGVHGLEAVVFEQHIAAGKLGHLCVVGKRWRGSDAVEGLLPPRLLTYLTRQYEDSLRGECRR